MRSVNDPGALRWSLSWFRSPRPTLSTRRVDSADGLPRYCLMQWVGLRSGPLLSPRILGLLAVRGSFGPPLHASRSALVIGIATNAVRVSLDSECERGIGEHDATDLCQLLARQRTKGVLGGVEENVRHVDDEAARGVASLENGIEFLQ